MFKLIWSLAFVTLLSIPILNSASGAERREVMEFTEFGDPSNSARSEVGVLIDTFKSSWAAQDTDSHLELFADDAEWINAYARMFRGTEELAVFLRERLFPNFASAVSQEEIRNARLISIRYLNDDAAIIHMYTDGRRGPSAVQGEVMRRTHIHLVAEKSEQLWRIVHAAIMDARE